MNKKRYPHRVDLNISEKQYQLLIEKSKKNNLTMTEFLRMQIEYAPKNLKSMQKILQDLRYEINKIGVNINQIAHAANSNFLTEESKNQLIAYSKKLYEKLGEVVRELGD